MLLPVLAYNSVMRFGFVVSTLLLVASFATADPFKPSTSQQIKLGQDAAKEIRADKKVKVLPESDPRVKELRRFGAMLVNQIPANERKATGFTYTFDVIDSKEVNAFALPGGPIFFYTGLLEKMKTEDQLVGVLGHELTHIRKEHWARQYSTKIKEQLGILVLLGLAKANKDISNIVLTASDVYSLRYSRSHESESDAIGYEMVVNAGYNPQGMADIFKIFASMGGRGPEFLNSHPDASKRAEAIESRIKKAGTRFPAQRLRGLFADLPTPPTTGIVTRGPFAWDSKGWPVLIPNN